MPLLPFLERTYPHGPLRDLWKFHDHDVPESPGVYILLGPPTLRFPYPRHRSAVLYIGQSKNIRERLGLHLKFASEARDERKDTLYWPRYEWAAAHGARYTYILTKRRETPKDLEDEVLAMFAEYHRAWPVGNGVGSWNALLTPEQLRRRQKKTTSRSAKDFGLQVIRGLEPRLPRRGSPTRGGKTHFTSDRYR